jgi:elongator complex protein 1
MRNLKNDRWRTYSAEPEIPFTALTWDTTNESIICATGPSRPHGTIILKRSREKNVDSTPNGDHSPDPQSRDFKDIVSWDTQSPNADLEYDQIVSLKFFGDTQTICLVLAGGDIVVVREEPIGSEDRIEIVGSVDAGITAAGWSPDEELLAISTGAETLLLMTRDYEGVVDVNLTPDDFKASQHVSVGWGKAETQFKGKRAKALRDPTMPEHVDEGRQSTYDDGKACLSWRGDGAYVALSILSKERGRVIRVFSREATLDSVSEPVDGLEHALCWRPAGNLIASVQRLKDRIDIVFFERNGLRHGQFPLRLSTEELTASKSVMDLKWNIDSTVLAVILKDQVQLWTMGNYHYYMKQELELSSSFINFCWHPEKPLLFGLITLGMTSLSASN